MEDFFDMKMSEVVQVRSVKTCQVGATLKSVIETMQSGKIGSIVIMDGESVAGIITERDILNEVVGRSLDLESEIVDEYMTSKPVCIGVEADLKSAFKYMRVGGFRHLIVVEKDNKLHSMISANDLVRLVNDNFNLMSVDAAV